MSVSEMEGNQVSSPCHVSDKQVLSPDAFSPIPKVTGGETAGEMQLDVGKGLLDEVSKEVAGKVNYDGLLISTSLIDKADYKPIQDEVYDFDVPEEHLNMSLTGVTQTSIESDSFDLDTFLGIRKLHVASIAPPEATLPQLTETVEQPETKEEEEEEEPIVEEEEPIVEEEEPIVEEETQAPVASSLVMNDDQNIVNDDHNVDSSDVAVTSSKQSVEDTNRDHNVHIETPAPTSDELNNGMKDTANNSDFLSAVDDKATPTSTDTGQDKTWLEESETPSSAYVTPPTRICETSSETSGAITADSADISSSSYSSACLMSVDYSKISPIKAPALGEEEGKGSDSKKEVPKIRTSSLRKPSAKKGAFSSSPLESGDSDTVPASMSVKNSTFTLGKASGSEDEPVSSSNETQVLEAAADSDKKTPDESLGSSVSSMKSEDTTATSKIAKSRLVKPLATTGLAGKSKLVRPASAGTRSTNATTSNTGLTKKTIKPNLLPTKGKTLATASTTRPVPGRHQPLTAGKGGGEPNTVNRGTVGVATTGLKSKSASSIVSKNNTTTSTKPTSGGTTRPTSGGTTRPTSGGTARPTSGGTTRPTSGGTARPTSGGTARPTMASRTVVKGGATGRGVASKGVDAGSEVGGGGVKKRSVRSGLVPPSVQTTTRPSSAKTGSQAAPPTRGASLITKPATRRPAGGVAKKKTEDNKVKLRSKETKVESKQNDAQDVTTPTDDATPTRRHSIGSSTPSASDAKTEATPNKLKRRSFIPTPTRKQVDKEYRPVSYHFDDQAVKQIAQPRLKGTLAPPRGGVKSKENKPINAVGPSEDELESNAAEFEYDPEFEKQLLSLTSGKPKVYHSPLNKDNLSVEPHSEWSPVPRRMTYLPGDESIQCTKYTHIRNSNNYQ